MNQPYVKKIDENGNVINPIVGSYMSVFPNRESRRRNTNKYLYFENGVRIRLHSNRKPNARTGKTRFEHLMGFKP